MKEFSKLGIRPIAEAFEKEMRDHGLRRIHLSGTIMTTVTNSNPNDENENSQPPTAAPSPDENPRGNENEESETGNSTRDLSTLLKQTWVLLTLHTQSIWLERVTLRSKLESLGRQLSKQEKQEYPDQVESITRIKAELATPPPESDPDDAFLEKLRTIASQTWMSLRNYRLRSKVNRNYRSLGKLYVDEHGSSDPNLIDESFKASLHKLSSLDDRITDTWKSLPPWYPAATRTASYGCSFLFVCLLLFFLVPSLSVTDNDAIGVNGSDGPIPTVISQDMILPPADGTNYHFAHSLGLKDAPILAWLTVHYDEGLSSKQKMSLCTKYSNGSFTDLPLDTAQQIQDSQNTPEASQKQYRVADGFVMRHLPEDDHWEPFAKIGATPGDSWESVHPDGTKIKYKFIGFANYRKWTCAVIEDAVFVNNTKVSHTQNWYAKGVGQVRHWNPPLTDKDGRQSPYLKNGAYRALKGITQDENVIYSDHGSTVSGLVAYPSFTSEYATLNHSTDWFSGESTLGSAASEQPSTGNAAREDVHAESATLPGRQLEASVGTPGVSDRPTDYSDGILKQLNESVKSLRCVATESELTIVLTVDPYASVWDMTHTHPLIIRLFDKNGQYLNHFSTSSKFTANARVYDAVMAAKEALERTGNVSKANEHNVRFLESDPVQLTYTVSIRDMRDTSIVQVGFIN